MVKQNQWHKDKIKNIILNKLYNIFSKNTFPKKQKTAIKSWVKHWKIYLYL